MPYKVISLGIYKSEISGKHYPVIKEFVHVDRGGSSEDSNGDIEMYQTSCGMTLFLPEADGSIFCVELGEFLHPQ